MSNRSAPSAPASPTTAYGRPSSRSALSEVAGGDRRADVGAPDGAAVDLERRHDDEIEPVALAEGPHRVRRPAPVVAERGVGRHQQAGERESAT